VKPGFARTAALLFGIVAGAFVPQAHVWSWAIRWLIMGTLFLVFLQTRVTRSALRPSHAALLGANLVLAFVAWAFGWAVGGRDVALATFFAGVAPTATAAPVIVSFLRGRVDYVIASFLLTNIVVAALLPLLLPLVLGRATSDAMVHVLGSVALVVFGPMVLAWLLRSLHPAAAGWPAHLRNVSFGMWVAAIFLTTANASDFVQRQADTPRVVLVEIAATSLVVCAVNFALGRLIGGREFRREASQSLGQKNTTFTIYLALTYASPLIALGPTCYVIWHNLWNSWQLHRAAHRDARP
jgi:BASS family bile acid:Na+ symporter